MDQINLTKPEHLTSLASSGVLVSIEVNLWSATKLDRGISDEITTSKNAASAAGRYTKNLLADHPKHKALMNYRQTVANWMKRMTYDWAGDQRYLPTADVPKFMKEWRDHETAFATLFKSFDESYEDIISDMAFKQGDMFNRNDYPTRDKMRKKYGINLFVNDVPMNDYRVLVAKDIADELFDVYSGQTQRIVESIVTDQFKRMKDVMESISYCCGVDDVSPAGAPYDERKFKKRKIYDSTIDKAKDMVRLYKEFNLSNNAELAESIEMLEKTLRDVNAEILRESDFARSEVKEGVDEILNKFSSFKCFTE